jgi:hypothetical protein
MLVDAGARLDLNGHDGKTPLCDMDRFPGSEGE